MAWGPTMYTGLRTKSTWVGADDEADDGDVVVVVVVVVFCDGDGDLNVCSIRVASSTSAHMMTPMFMLRSGSQNTDPRRGPGWKA